ncbi:Phage integrase family protein [Nitrosospira sp. Nl5]|uniref:tyrosine-type recombinase/integrase n=1 Tax=Nitrosospira sp. Nl5 TaxID=200120 RepID=UPI000885263F|nr:tyrosine-type recombinase/integrase [Nitrosospira sp. Nl5]SCX92270.1 Phage integrase family protein [Nitrosospira sp. Nl5]
MNDQNKRMGRKPSKNLNLPKGMRARVQRSGRVFYYLDSGSKPRHEIPLGSDYTSAVMKWAELTVTEPTPAVTFQAVAERYTREIIPTKAPRTSKDNLVEIANLLKFFDEKCLLDDIEPLHVRQYLDWRGAKAKVRANREKALLSHIWNFARERGLTALANPCKGVQGFKEDGRDVFINDDVFNAVRDSASAAVRDAMDLAYLTGQRPADTLKMRETDIRDGAILVKQGKTKKSVRIRLMDDAGVLNGLGLLIENITARKKGSSVHNLALIISQGGFALSTSGLDNGFERARIKAADKADRSGQPDLAARIRGFQFRDLRAKAGTEKADSHGLVEARRQLGHSSVKMTEHYVRLGQIVTPTK